MGRFAKVIRILCFGAAAAVSPALPAAEPILVGKEFAYTVRRGDTLIGVGARFAVSPQSLAERNRFRVTKKLVLGQVLRVDNRHIVPNMLEDGILINIPQRLLFYFVDGRLDAWYPVALGQPGSLQTPSGSYQVLAQEEDPVWEVPVSIQEEMQRKGEKVRKSVAPGPENPLGRYWLGLSLTCCGIHGTNAPQSIYRFQTHGCIRLAPQDARDLFSRVSVGTPVEIVYEPVLLARDANGATFVEVHPDIYGRADGDFEKVATRSRRLPSVRESDRWGDVLRNEECMATRLSASPGGNSTDRIRESTIELGK